MTNAVLIDAAEVAQILDVSKAFAYKVVRELNEELKTGTLPYISGKSVKPLGYAECTPVHQNRLNFPFNSFQLCLDFSWTANLLQS